MEQQDKPVILIVDPAGADCATASEITERYLRSYTIAAVASAQQAIDEVRHLAADRHDVALILAAEPLQEPLSSTRLGSCIPTPAAACCSTGTSAALIERRSQPRLRTARLNAL